MKRKLMKKVSVLLAASMCLLNVPMVQGNAEDARGLTVTHLENQEPVDLPDAYNWNPRKQKTTVGESDGMTVGTSAALQDKTGPLAGDAQTGREAAAASGASPAIGSLSGAEIGALSPEEAIGSLEDQSKARSNYVEYAFDGAITQEGGMAYVAPIPLAPGQILHSQMDAPSSSSLDYDLYLYEYNASTGNLGARVDGSTLTNGNTVVPESVATINTGSASKNYAVIVLSKKGYSATDKFTLHLTLGEDGDPGETNDNAFTAYSLGEFSINAQAKNLSGATIDSPYDNDWYSIYVPNTTDFHELTVTYVGDSSKVNIDFYTANGTKLRRSSKDGDDYTVYAGYNYIRVSKADGSFSGNAAYKLKLNVKFYPKADASIIQFLMNGEPLPTQDYYVYVHYDDGTWEEQYQRRYAFKDSALFEWIIHYVSPSGYPATETDDILYAKFTDTAWSLNAAEGCRLVEMKEPSQGGIAHLSGNIMPSYSQKHYPNINLRYDYDCAMTLTSAVLGTFAFEEPIFITSRIMWM